MNDWQIRKVAIVEADDFQDRYDRNGLNFLFAWKAKYPDFKITLFTIPEKTSEDFWQEVVNESKWMETAVHGWNHESNVECYGWDYDKARTLLIRSCDKFFLNGGNGFSTEPKIFKAPGWAIYPGLNGYPSAPEDPITNDPLSVYRALMDLDFVVVDRHYNRTVRPEGLKVICIDCNPDIVHMHTWNMMTPDENSRNGFEQVEMRGVPWDANTKFYTMGEAWEQGLILPCQAE